MYCSWLTPRSMRFLKRLVILADLLISPCSFVILADLLILICVCVCVCVCVYIYIYIYFNNHTPRSWHCLLLYPLNTTPLLPKSSPLHFHPSLSGVTSPTPLPIVIGETGAESKHQILRETRQIWSGDF